jgi:hypothetical protein
MVMLTVHGSTTPLSITAGGVIGMGYALPPDAGPFTCARVLVVGDLLRRILEDVHSAQVLAAVITDDQAGLDAAWRSGLMVRPVVGVFSTRTGAEAGLGKPLDLVVAAAGSEHEQQAPPAVAVGPVHAAVPYPQGDLATVRFALESAPYPAQLELTSALLTRARTLLDRWRHRLDQWSRRRSYPIPPDWRAAAIDALDDDLNVARVVAMMTQLEDNDGIEPGAKFEAFSYLDRILAVDLSRDLGRT